jgi:hypothetical protein
MQLSVVTIHSFHKWLTYRVLVTDSAKEVLSGDLMGVEYQS